MSIVTTDLCRIVSGSEGAIRVIWLISLLNTSIKEGITIGSLLLILQLLVVESSPVLLEFPREGVLCAPRMVCIGIIVDDTVVHQGALSLRIPPVAASTTVIIRSLHTCLLLLRWDSSFCIETVVELSEELLHSRCLLMMFSCGTCSIDLDQIIDAWACLRCDWIHSIRSEKVLLSS